MVGICRLDSIYESVTAESDWIDTPNRLSRLTTTAPWSHLPTRENIERQSEEKRRESKQYRPTSRPLSSPLAKRMEKVLRFRMTIVMLVTEYYHVTLVAACQSAVAISYRRWPGGVEVVDLTSPMPPSRASLFFIDSDRPDVRLGRVLSCCLLLRDEDRIRVTVITNQTTKN